jgi:Lar family restriction alleviation protein
MKDTKRKRERMMQELKHCPFCGSNEHLEVVKPAPLYASNIFVIYCDNCGAMGGGNVTQELAADDWNMRRTPKTEAKT